MSNAEKEALIAGLDRARQRLNTALAPFDSQTVIYPAWKLKQFLDHLAGWDDAVLVALRAHACDETPAVVAPYGVDHYNAQTVTIRETLPIARTVSEVEITRQLIKRTLLDLPDERFHHSIVTPWGQTMLVRDMIEVFIHHENEHARELEEIVLAQPAPSPAED